MYIGEKMPGKSSNERNSIQIYLRPVNFPYRYISIHEESSAYFTNFVKPFVDIFHTAQKIHYLRTDPFKKKIIIPKEVAQIPPPASENKLSAYDEKSAVWLKTVLDPAKGFWQATVSLLGWE